MNTEDQTGRIARAAALLKQRQADVRKTLLQVPREIQRDGRLWIDHGRERYQWNEEITFIDEVLKALAAD